MKLSEIKGERAIEVVADLIDPVSKLIRDDRFKELMHNKDVPKTEAVKYLLKEHKKTIIEILAVIDGADPLTYEPNILSLPMMIMDIINDPDVAVLFGSQGQSETLASSGPAMENIEAKEE